MLLNYLRLAIRNLIKNRVSSAVNLVGFTLGISAGLIVFLIIQYEANFDNFHSKANRIYRVVRHEVTNTGDDVYSASLPFPAYRALSNDFADLEGVTQIFTTRDYSLQHDADRWNQDDILFADSAFLHFFDFEVLEGNVTEALKQPNRMAVTEEFAFTHFGNQSPVGEIIRVAGVSDVEIAAVMKNPPSNSHLPFSVVMSMGTFRTEFIGGFEYDNWGVGLGFTCYLLLPENINPGQVNDRLKAFVTKYLPEADARTISYSLQPLREIHFDRRYADSNARYTLDKAQLWILGSVGFFILLLACINFVNLSTAVAMRKAKEVGIRKVVGASRTQLVYQYLGEAFVITLLALLASMGVTERVIPMLNSFLDAKITFSLAGNGLLIQYILLLLVFVTLASGLYPAWVLSGYHPAAALKSNMASGKSQRLRKLLITTQFVISQVLIIGTIVVAQQMDFVRSKPLGFDKDLILTVTLADQDPVKNERFKNRLLQNTSIQKVALGLGAPTSENDIGSDFQLEGSEENYRTRIKPADLDYLTTYGVRLLAGRWFLKPIESGIGDEFVVNEELVKRLGFTTPDEAIGKIITTGVNGAKGPIVGVVSDFHMQPLSEPIQPAILFQFPELYFEAGVKISGTDIPRTLSFIKDAWYESFPDGYFRYSFLDQTLAKNYQREENLYLMFETFTTLSIAIGCLGLFGLISFLVVHKTKEVGVRKVMGASIHSIVMLFSANFIKLIGLAFLIAVPVAWYLMNIWLDDFAYKIDLTAWYFIWGGVINLVIALVTISFQAIKAAMANPVESLRYE